MKPWEKYSELTSETSDSQVTQVESGPWEKYSEEMSEKTTSSNQPKKTELQQMFATTPTLITDGIIAPMVELSRGLYRSTGSFYGKLDAVAQLIEKGTGLKRGGLFQEWSQQLEQTAKSLPQTGLMKPVKTIYEMIGSAPAVISEFAVTSKIPGLQGTGKLTQVGQFSLLEALDEYEKNPELKSLAKGAATGAGMGAFAITSFNVAERTLDLLWKGGKQVAKTYISFVTGDKNLGEKFVKDPLKYNLRLRSKVKNFEEVKQENKLKSDELNLKYKNEKMLYKDNFSREKEIMDIKLKDAETSLKEATLSAKQSLSQKNAATLDEVTNKATSAIEKSQQTLQEKAVTVYDNALAKYNLVKKEAGEKVELAVNNILEKDPLASVPSSFVKKKVDNLLKTKAPFIAEKGDQYTTRTAAGNQQEVKVFNNIIDEFNARVEQNDLTVGYLQYLKRDLQELSSKHHAAGNGELGKFYTDFSKTINPVNLADDLVKQGVPNISNSLKELAQANREYASLMPKYERAMDKYFTKNVRDEYIPNPKKALTALANNDVSAIREMKIADMALPKEDQLFPKITDLANQADKIALEQKTIIKSLKKKAQMEQKELSNASRQSIQNLQKKQHLLRTEEKNKITTQIREFNNTKDSEYNEIIKGLVTEENFFKQQDLLRQQAAAGSTGASLLQHILGFGGVAAIKYGNIVSGGSSLTAALMLSPNVAAKTTRNLLIQQENARAILMPLLKRKILQQIAGTKAEQQ